MNLIILVLCIVVVIILAQWKLSFVIGGAIFLVVLYKILTTRDSFTFTIDPNIKPSDIVLGNPFDDKTK